MERTREHRVAACVCFMAAFVLASAAVCPFDDGFDAFALSEEVARNDADQALSTACGITAILGLASLWPYGVRSWGAGAAAGLLAAFAAGGLHVMGHAAACLPLALPVGFLGGLMLLTVGGRQPGACALFGVEVCLAIVQVLFIIVN